MKLSDREWKAISITSLFSNLETGKINNASNLKKTKTDLLIKVKSKFLKGQKII